MSEKTEELRVCLNCGYERGFHVFFRRLPKSRMHIGLICPSCGQSYDIGWITADIKEFEAIKGESYPEK
ncbi:hypothetical protein [uncultured Methanomethylovorans sp.]|uniref:hypothetical protein n=1 Tax=uncultured Methanomethylovorans sp. TaxID=183759 RepID=UPI002AA69753|nr:hypothetical protein [uncultured Methanomethylovorans sp.]